MSSVRIKNEVNLMELNIFCVENIDTEKDVLYNKE